MKLIRLVQKATEMPVLSSFYRLYKRYKNREYKVSYGGENPNLTFYIYGQDDDRGGLWWTINKVLMHIGYAVDKGYIPVVDMQNYYSQYQNEGDLHNINTWERFFKQPCGYTLNDIKNSRNIIIASKIAAPQDFYLMGNQNFYDNPAKLAYFRTLFKNYIFFNNNVQGYLDDLVKNKLGSNRVLGVLCRGTDYLKLKPKGHPVQPDPNDVINKCKEIATMKDCSHVFLATEDKNILESFKIAFKDKLIYLEQERASQEQLDGNVYLASVYRNRNCDKYEMGLNYLAAIYLLSKCSCFIGGRTGGTKGVLLLRNQQDFDYTYIYNLGIYQ